jgi:hypothetical protein
MSDNLPSGIKEFGIATDYVHDNIYIIGGKVGNSVIDLIYIFDTIDRKIYKSDQRLNVARCNAKITILNNKIYVIGGETSRGVVSNIEMVEIIDKYNINSPKIID